MLADLKYSHFFLLFFREVILIVSDCFQFPIPIPQSQWVSVSNRLLHLRLRFFFGGGGGEEGDRRGIYFPIHIRPGA